MVGSLQIVSLLLTSVELGFSCWRKRRVFNYIFYLLPYDSKLCVDAGLRRERRCLCTLFPVLPPFYMFLCFHAFISDLGWGWEETGHFPCLGAASHEKCHGGTFPSFGPDDYSQELLARLRNRGKDTILDKRETWASKWCRTGDWKLGLWPSLGIFKDRLSVNCVWVS